MPLESYSPEFGRKWADDPKETITVNPPATKFYTITQVVMVEYEEEPPGRAPYREVKTVLAENKKELTRQGLGPAIDAVHTIAGK
jgi:hypothetical protein